MNRKNRIKLGALSKIDDNILDRATDRRYKLLARRRLKKLWIGLVAAAACLAILLSTILIVPLFGKQVPIYRGMSVSNQPPLMKASTDLPDDLLDEVLLLSTDVPTSYPGAVFLKTDNPHANENGKIPPKAEEEILSSLDVTGAEKTLYYAQPNQDIYVTVHIENPDQFEIQSFTLNGKKYSSYMFEEGSDMENLVLKVNVGDVSGYVDYTIDAIKYIDGTEIKDVKLEGNKTVRVGVATSEQPKVSFQNQTIDFTSISFDLTLTDPIGLVASSEGKLGAVLLDEKGNLLQGEILSLGENSIKFSDLLCDTTYRFVVVGYYDSLEGEEGPGLHIIAEKSLTTPRVIRFSDSSTATTTSFASAVIWDNKILSRSVDAIELYQNGTKLCDLSLDADSQSFSAGGLLPYTLYTVRVTYSYDLGDGGGVQSDTIETQIATTTELSVNSITKHPTQDQAYIIRLNNPHGVTISALHINEKAAKINSALSSPSALVVELRNYQLSQTGLVTLHVTSLTYDCFGRSCTQTDLRDDASLDIYIPTTISCKSAKFVNEQGDAVSYCFPSNPAYLLLEVDNESDYPITNVQIYPNSGFSSDPLSNLSAIRLEKGLYRVNFPADFVGVCEVESVALTYGDEYFSKSVSFGFARPSQSVHPSCLFLSSDTIYEISSAEDLLSIHSDGFCYFRQTADIDLGGRNWFGPALYGVFDGNGYKIKNMQNIGEYTYEPHSFGLFESVMGIVKNVTISDAIMSVKSCSWASGSCFGTITGEGISFLILDQCVLDGCSITLDASETTSASITYYDDVYVGKKPEYYKNQNCTTQNTDFYVTPSTDYEMPPR